MVYAITIYVLSDSLGETAQYVARASASQFPDVDITYKHIPYVDDLDYLYGILESIDPKRSVLFYTLVHHNLRSSVQLYCERAGIQTVDILSDAFGAISEVTKSPPVGIPGNIRRMDDAYFKKIAAIEFAIQYDDGKESRGLQEADIVLVGVSRTSKTPLSMYLAHHGIKVANIPLVPSVSVPDVLFDLPRGKVIGLMIRPDILEEIRDQRLKEMGVKGQSAYTDMMQILDELDFAENLMKRLGCPIIDVSHKAIEETANIVLQIFYNRRGEANCE